MLIITTILKVNLEFLTIKSNTYFYTTMETAKTETIIFVTWGAWKGPNFYSNSRTPLNFMFMKFAVLVCDFCAVIRVFAPWCRTHLVRTKVGAKSQNFSWKGAVFRNIFWMKVQIRCVRRCSFKKICWNGAKCSTNIYVHEKNLGIFVGYRYILIVNVPIRSLMGHLLHKIVSTIIICLQNMKTQLSVLHLENLDKVRPHPPRTAPKVRNSKN